MIADLIIAVDGINSHARQFLGSDMPEGNLGNSLDRSGWAAFRLIAEVSQLHQLEDSLEFGTSHRCNCFVGDGCSIMTYKIKGQDKVNLVLSHRDDVDTTTWSQAEYQKEISKLFKAFHPDLQKLLDITMANENYQITNWPVYMVRTLPRWFTGGGKFLLLGDNTHAMPYFLSMGVSMAAEDAASITECLSLTEESHGQVNLQRAMELLEAIRKPRAEIVRNASLNAGRVIHLPAGKDRDLRNAQLRDNGGPSVYDRKTSREEMEQLASGNRYGDYRQHTPRLVLLVRCGRAYQGELEGKVPSVDS